VISERYNRTQSTELRKHLLDEEDWDLSLSMAVFRYNATLHASTGMTPYKAMLESEVFEFDCGLLQRWNIDAEPEDLPRRLVEVHAELLIKGLKSRDEAACAYNRAVDLTQFEEGSRVLVYNESGALAHGRSCGSYGSARTAWKNDCPMLVTSCARRTTRALRGCM
jgi:hypothetical protein